MTRVLQVDEHNDIFLGPNGSLAIATGLQAVMDACAQAAKTQLGEMVFAVDEGLPNFAAVWNGAPNVSQFEAFLRRTLLEVPDVLSVEAVTVSVSGGVLAYRATISTIYGPGALTS